MCVAEWHRESHGTADLDLLTTLYIYVDGYVRATADYNLVIVAERIDQLDSIIEYVTSQHDGMIGI